MRMDRPRDQRRTHWSAFTEATRPWPFSSDKFRVSFTVFLLGDQDRDVVFGTQYLQWNSLQYPTDSKESVVFQPVEGISELLEVRYCISQ